MIVLSFENYVTTHTVPPAVSFTTWTTDERRTTGTQPGPDRYRNDWNGATVSSISRFLSVPGRSGPFQWKNGTVFTKIELISDETQFDL